MNGNPAKIFELALGKKPQIQTGVSCACDCMHCCWIFFPPCVGIFAEKKPNYDQNKNLKVTGRTPGKGKLGKHCVLRNPSCSV